jgi:outer membrane protein TolC
MKKLIALVAFLGFFFTKVQAQDSLMHLTPGDFMNWVRAYHPISVNASYWDAQSKAQLMSARGAWDPVLSGDWKRKEFKDSRYYNLFNAQLEVPTPIGVSVVGGFDQNEGVYLNPENNTTNEGLTYLGIEVPLISGLLFDERRGAVRIAKTMRDLNEAEQQMILNELFLQAIVAYAEWSYAHFYIDVVRETQVAAQERYIFVRNSYRYGNVAAIDTLEANIQLQNRNIALNEAEIQLYNARLRLSSFLWDSTQTALNLSDLAIPVPYDSLMMVFPEISDLPVFQLLNSNPELRALQYELDILQIDRRVKNQKLMPKLNAQYNLLNQPINFGGSEYFNRFNANDYTFGLKWEYPIFIRAARGELQLNSIKQWQTENKIDQKARDIEIKVRSYMMEIKNRRSQLEATYQVADDYRRLLDGEYRKFDQGSSSLFIVNQREVKYLETQQKVLDNQLKLLKTYGKLIYTVGNLHDQF